MKAEGVLILHTSSFILSTHRLGGSLALPILACALLVSVSTTAAAQEGETPPERPPEPPRFRTVDVIIDSAKKRLAAYQVEITFDSERVKIVSLEGGGGGGGGEGGEGGDPPAGEEGGEGGEGGFAEPPFYDAAGKTAGRIVIAGFVPDDEQAKAGKTRVARLHLMVEVEADAGEGAPELAIEPVTAARPGGEEDPVLAELVTVGDGDKAGPADAGAKDERAGRDEDRDEDLDEKWDAEGRAPQKAGADARGEPDRREGEAPAEP